MPRLKCPRCATVIDVAPGASPVCPACGFGGPAPAPAAPAAAQTGWSGPPPMQSGFSSPPMAGPMHRPGWVTFVAVMEFIGGGLAILGGLLLLLGGSFLAAIFEEGLGELGDVFGAILMVIGIVLVGLGVLSIFIGLGLLKGRSWARMTAIVLTIIGAVFSLISLIAGDFTNLVGLVLDGLILYALFNPQSKAWFEHMDRNPTP